MPTTTLFSCASQALIDQRTNSLSLIGIHEAFETATLPLVVPELAIVWIKRRDPQDTDHMEFKLDVKVNGNASISFPVAVDFQKSKMHRSIVVIGGFLISEPGFIHFDIRQDGKKIATQSIEVLLHPQSTASPSTGSGAAERSNKNSASRSARTPAKAKAKIS